ncbi:MAG: sporulation protein YqfD [Bacillota bacterium]
MKEKTSEKVAVGVKKSGKNSKKLSKFHVECMCYNGGRIHEYLIKNGWVANNFSCAKGLISFDCSGAFESEIFQIIKKCGGENAKITAVGKSENFKKALPILAGVAVFFIVILLSNLLVLKVEVYGEDDVLKVHIENLASEIYPTFTIKTDEKLSTLKSEISACENVAFFTARIYQNTLIINFLEAENAEIISGETSVIAPENGTIISVLTLSGTAVKFAGDTVKKGDDIILAITGGESPEEIEKAVGSVVMEVEKSSQISLLQEYAEKNYSGDSETSTYLIINGVEVFKKESEFENFDVSSVAVEYLTPNIQIVKETQIEYTKNSVILTPDEAVENAVAIFKSRYLSDFAYTITDIQTAVEMEGETFKVDVICKYLLHFS